MSFDQPLGNNQYRTLSLRILAVILALATVGPRAQAAMPPHVAAQRLPAMGEYASQPAARGASRASALPASSTTPVRALGAYIYGAPWNPSAIDAFTTLVGAAPAIVMWYQDWARSSDNAFDPAIMNAVVSRGAMPMVTWEPWDPTLGTAVQPAYALRAIIAGTYDAYIHQFARAAAAWGRPFYLRFAHEMNGNWYPWSPGINGNTSASFVAAWQHVVTIFRQDGATNARWVWSPNVEYGGSTPFTAIYPGDAYVDAVALDGYNWGTSQPGKTWQSFAAVFGQSYADMTSLTGKPLIIAEVASSEVGGDKATWITQGLLSAVPSVFPRVSAVIWFDENKETDWRVNSSPASLAAYQQVAASPLFRQSAVLAATNTPTPLPPTTTATSIPPTATPVPPTATASPHIVFATSFESGDPQPSWNDVAWATGITGICCGLTSPESSVRQEIAHTGTKALMYSGLATGAAQDYSYNQLFDLSSQHITVGPTTTLSYWIYPQSNSLTQGANSTYVAIDLLFTDGSALRNSGAVDQYGVPLHPHYQGQGGHLILNTWNLVTSHIGAQNAGKTINRILVGYDQPGSAGGYRGYIDDLTING